MSRDGTGPFADAGLPRILGRVGPAVAVTGALWAAVAGFAVVALASHRSGAGSTVLPVLCLATAGFSGAVAVAVRRVWVRDVAVVEAALQAAAIGRWSPIDPAAVPTLPRLAGQVNTVTERLHQVLLAVARSSAALSAGRRGIHDVSEAMSSAAETLGAEAANAASTAEQVEGSVHVVAGGSRELAASVEDVAKHAIGVTKITDAATRQAERATATMVALSEASSRIEHVVELIATIAGQTRMLALNATIEAARAGEAGKGFAVVANEVRALAQATAEATERVANSVREVQAGAGEAGSAIGEIVETIDGIGESQSAIAAAVEEQTNSTNEIGRCAAQAASGSGAIATSVRALEAAARVTAYSGAQIRTTSGELAAIGKDLAEILADFDTDALMAEVAEQKTDVPAPTATTRNGVTFVEDTVAGTGPAEFEYVGDWCHSTANIETDGSNSYCATPDDVVHLRFTGTQARFYAITGPNHGIGAVSVDGGEEHIVDMHSQKRTAGVMLYRTPRLPHGQHTITVRVTGKKHPQSRYTWVTIDRVEFE